jgi:hypothetical protein
MLHDINSLHRTRETLITVSGRFAPDIAREFEEQFVDVSLFHDSNGRVQLRMRSALFPWRFVWKASMKYPDTLIRMLVTSKHAGAEVKVLDGYVLERKVWDTDDPDTNLLDEIG